MELSLIDQFNQTNTVEVWDKVRIKNLVANSILGVIVRSKEAVTISFSTTKKNKAPIVMNYTIKNENLTEEQKLRVGLT